MLATAVIVFREILEAALIIGIVAAATQGVLRRGLWIGGGVVLGVAGAIVVAGLAEVIVAWADGMGQELFNALILLAAVAMLAWHNIWMASHSRELVAEMKQVGNAVKQGEPMLALVLVVAIAVLREGAEIVLFLYGQAAQGVSITTMFSGGSAGLAVGALIGLAMYFGLLRIPTKYLFSVTGWMILLLAAGMASQAAKFLAQADMLPAWGSTWDTSRWLANDSVSGKLLHTLVGYDANPMGIQIAVYLLTVITIGVAMKMVDQNNVSTQSNRANTLVKIAALALSLPLLGMAPNAKAGPASAVDSPRVVRGETELEFSGGQYFDHRDNVDGEREWEFAIGHGMTDFWFSEVEGAWEREADHGSSGYEGFAWINIFQLTQPGEQIADFGLYTEFAFPDDHDEANEFEIGPMIEKQLGAAVYNLNLIWVRDYNHQADEITTFEYNFQARVIGDPMLEFGVQAFGDLGEWSNMHSFNDQEHKIGPAIFGETQTGTKSKLAYDGALLFGVTDDSQDVTLRFTVSYEMY